MMQNDRQYRRKRKEKERERERDSEEQDETVANRENTRPVKKNLTDKQRMSLFGIEKKEI